MNIQLTNNLLAAKQRAKYDTEAKSILSNKIILAHILIHTIDEFKGMNPNNVVPYIEGEPYVGSVPIEPGLTNKKMEYTNGEKILGFNSIHSESNEGVVTFDILFFVKMKNGLTRMNINLEMQTTIPSNYHLLNRGLFYASRILSSQRGRIFTDMNYDDIENVVSIWLCMNTNINCMSHYHLVKDDIFDSYNWGGNLNMLSVILVGICKEECEQNEQNELYRLLWTLFTTKIGLEKKFEIIEKEYHIPMTRKIEGGIENMCNLAQGIANEAKMEGKIEGMIQGKIEGKIAGVTETTENIVLKMYSDDFPMDKIAFYTNRTSAEIQIIIQKHKNLKHE